MNIVFDLGGVIISADFKKFYMEKGYSEDISKKMERLLFDDPYWNDYDKGLIKSNEDMLKLYYDKYPEYKEYLKDFFEGDWMNKILYTLDDGVKLLYKMKEEGHKLYVLSNFPLDPFETIYNKYELFKLFDGMIISSHVLMVKPNDDIYQKLISTYNLVPEETIFIDDRLVNIEGARRNKINGIVYKNYENTMNELEKYLK